MRGWILAKSLSLQLFPELQKFLYHGGLFIVSLKKFFKKYCPDFLYPFARSCYRYYFRKIIVPKIIARAEKIKPYYRDELSCLILSDREKYLLTRDKNIFIDRAVKQGWKFYQSYNRSNILVIYDDKNSKEFNYSMKFLKICGFSDKYRIITLDEFMKNSRISNDELIVPLLSEKNLTKFLSYACEKNLLYKHNIYTYNLMSIREDIQYFDVFDPVDDEIIIDAGCYDGTTAKQFLQWGGDKVKKIYSFEFDPINAAKCEENLKDLRDKVILIKKGTWDKDEILHVSTSGGGGSSVLGATKGNAEIYLTSIDSVVKDERVTFIKMDIEGAELKSLMGAKNTIIKNKPRLAICVYHKPEDICEIPEYILSLVPEYKFYLRHYTTSMGDTILYASCD